MIEVLARLAARAFASEGGRARPSSDAWLHRRPLSGDEPAEHPGAAAPTVQAVPRRRDGVAPPIPSRQAPPQPEPTMPQPPPPPSAPTWVVERPGPAPRGGTTRPDRPPSELRPVVASEPSVPIERQAAPPAPAVVAVPVRVPPGRADRPEAPAAHPARVPARQVARPVAPPVPPRARRAPPPRPVEVTIERVDVRVTPAPANKPAARTAPEPRLGLAEYLAGRDEDR